MASILQYFGSKNHSVSKPDRDFNLSQLMGVARLSNSRIESHGTPTQCLSQILTNKRKDFYFIRFAQNNKDVGCIVVQVRFYSLLHSIG